MTDEVARAQLVVIGSSAGGIEALSRLVATLPLPFPAPIIVAQHLDPSRESHLTEILARQSTLPVQTVSHKQHLEPGVVYVVPANRQVQIADHEILLSEGSERPTPSVNRLLRSAAAAYGEDLIAVILTGSGSDGAVGAREVKRAGGTVIIQDPKTARFPAMPESLAQSSVDIVTDIQHIGPLLLDLLQRTGDKPREDDEKLLPSILEDVRKRTGIDFQNYKQPTILRRLRRRVVATDTADLQSYSRYLRAHPEEYQNLINSFLIKVTEFLRDPALFAYLQAHILPELVANARGQGNELRIWSAGCATGEEAYSLAILVSEVLGDDLEHLTVRIFGTDLDAASIAFARRGIYPADALSALPEELIARHFTPIDGAFQVKKRLRALTVFGDHDLGQRAPFPRVDLVLCRNVLIYFTTELQRRAMQLFAFSLRNGGYLVLGKAETANLLPDLFAPHHPPLRIYRRHGERAVVPTALFLGSTPRRALPSALVSASPERPPRAPERQRAPLDSTLASLPVGVAVVDRNYDILQINRAAQVLLSIHGPALGQDLIHRAKGLPSGALRDGIDAAFRGEARPPLGEVPVETLSNSDIKFLRISCLPGAQGAGDVESALVVIEDTTALVRAERALKEAEERLQRLPEHNRLLVLANEELAHTNAELRSANEAHQLAREESQAASEEVETLNEELQATNEELETNNEELQATIEELNTTTADLEARGRELQELTSVAEAERTRLRAVLASIGDAVVLVSREGEVLLSNDAYQQLPTPAPLWQDRAGRPIPAAESPIARASRGESFRMEFSTPLPGDGRRYYEAVGQPLGPAPGPREAGVVAIRDITDSSLRHSQDQFLAMASHELRTPLVPLQGYLQMLLKVLPSDEAEPRLREYANIALSQARRLATLSRDLTDATRLQSGKLLLRRVASPLAPLLHHCATLAQALSARHTIQTLVADDTLVVLYDSERLEQVLMNLLTNAIKYAPESPNIELRLARDGDQAALEVIDHGPGIPAADLPHVFSCFYQSARSDRPADGGLGLGLFISEQIIALHQGTIQVTSAPGQGARFTIRLPLHTPAAPPR